VASEEDAMKGSPELIELLNDALTAELTAINQYFVQAKMCDNWGYARLGQRLREESIDEMRDAEALVERILYLEGVPNLQRLGSVMVGQTVAEQHQVNLDLERAAIERLNRGILECRSAGDDGTSQVLERILAGEEEHADWLETQLELIGQIGEPLYLAQQVRT
jgi:bacterioferritin